MRVEVVLVAMALLLAGCLGGSGGAEPTAEPDADGPDPVRSSGPVDSGPTSSADLETPPEWYEGKWWKYRIQEDFTGSSYETMRVITGLEPATDSYLAGMPQDQWLDKALALHVPGFGRVGRQDLSFEIHDCPFQPVDFPLTDGKTWQTEFECRPVNATATLLDETTAEIEMTGPNDHLVLTYDAEVGAVTEMIIDNYATIEMVDHGDGFRGNVTVPHMHDLVFMHGRVAGALNLSLRPAAPAESVTVDDTYDRVSFVIILGSILPDTSGPNTFYQETATAPDGTTYEERVTAADEPGIRLLFYQHDDPGGTWELQHVAAGPGIAMIEGIGYHVFDESVG